MVSTCERSLKVIYNYTQGTESPSNEQKMIRACDNAEMNIV